jgi:SAM-dependent methyltransferase
LSVVQNEEQWSGAVRRIKFTLRVPAVLALMIQLGSLAALLIFTYGISELTTFQVSIALAVLLQGALAAALSHWMGLAIWWVFIQFLFPGALIAMQWLNLPPSLFLLVFVFLLGLYWTTFRTQVPFFPSGPATWKVVENMLPQGRTFRFIDIGSGLGGLVMHLAERRPDSKFVGIEVAPLPWLVSFLRARVNHSASLFMRGDYGQLDFAEFDVVFAYLSPAAMSALWEKASVEMRPGALLLSYEFPISGVKPHVTSAPDDHGSVIYGWYI